MRALSLKLKSYGAYMPLLAGNHPEGRILHFLLASFGALALMYLLILGNMVFNIVERRNYEEHIRTLSSEVRDLELSYLALTSEIDLNYSHALGFRETDIKFATRKTVGSINGKIKVTPNEI